MKKSLSFIAAALVMTACNNSNNTFTLTGTIDPAFNGAEVLLSRDSGERDTTVVENGTFKFTGECDTPQMALVAAFKDNKYVQGNFVMEKGNLTIKFDEKGVPECSGTALNDVYNSVESKFRELTQEFNSKYEALASDTTVADDVVRKVADSLYRKMKDDRVAFLNTVFDSNKDNIVGAEAMASLYNNKQEFDSLYNIAGDAVKNYPKIAAEKVRMENIDKTAEGKMFTDFTIENGSAEGTAVKLSDYVGKGKYVLVDFWASWCGPCKGEMPNLAEIYKKYKGDKFEILGVAVWDKRKDTEKALETLPISWPVIFDAQKVPTEIYGINGIPQIILFGPDGTIVARNLRGEQIGEKLAEVLGK